MESDEQSIRALVETWHRATAAGDVPQVLPLSVTVTPLKAGLPQRRTGNALSILHKQTDGAWVVVRDANMLVAE